MNLPLVSIVIPVYNGANYLREAIESALAQTYQNVEIIVVNDGSDDEGATEVIALSYGKKIRYFKKTNGGVASALNLGILNMSGEFFSWLSHDDMYKPEKIEKQILESFNHGSKTLIWSNFDIVNETGTIIDSFELYEKNKKSDAFVILSTFVHGCSLLIPSFTFREVGLFNESLLTVQDNEMWIRALNAGYRFVHLREKLIVSRRHDEQGQVKLAKINKTETIDFYRWVIGCLKENLLPCKEEMQMIMSKKGICLEL